MSKPAELFYAEARRENQQLVVLGLVEQSNNPAHPQFDVIRGIWHTRFLARNPSKPMVLYEGSREPVRSRSLLINDEVTSVKMGDEFRLLATLADKSAIPSLPDQDEVLRQTLQVATAANVISPAVVNYYFDAQARPGTSDTPFNHRDLPTIEHLAQDVRSYVLGKNVTQLWNDGYSPFVLCRNETLMNWPVQEAFKAIPEFTQAEPITLLPPTPPYAALPRLAPVSV